MALYRFKASIACIVLAAILPFPAMALGGGTKEKLKKGGYVILMRSASAMAPADAPSLEAACQPQRSLDAQARPRTQLVADRFQKAGIKITKALSSRWCRAMDTAKFLAPNVIVETREELAAYLNHKDPAVRHEIVNKVRAEIASWKGPGNLLFVSNKNTLKVISGRSLGRGAFIVVDPRTMRIIAEDN